MPPAPLARSGAILGSCNVADFEPGVFRCWRISLVMSVVDSKGLVLFILDSGSSVAKSSMISLSWSGVDVLRSSFWLVISRLLAVALDVIYVRSHTCYPFTRVVSNGLAVFGLRQAGTLAATGQRKMLFSLQSPPSVYYSLTDPTRALTWVHWWGNELSFITWLPENGLLRLSLSYLKKVIFNISYSSSHLCLFIFPSFTIYWLIC